jgi:hypothetical protein
MKKLLTTVAAVLPIFLLALLIMAAIFSPTLIVAGLAWYGVISWWYVILVVIVNVNLAVGILAK